MNRSLEISRKVDSIFASIKHRDNEIKMSATSYFIVNFTEFSHEETEKEQEKPQ